MVDNKMCTHYIIKSKRAGYANNLRQIISQTIFDGCITKILVVVFRWRGKWIIFIFLHNFLKRFIEHDFFLIIRKDKPWLVWLSGLSAGLWSKGLLVWFQVRAHAWVAGQVPGGGCMRGNHRLMFLSLSFSLLTLV